MTERPSTAAGNGGVKKADQEHNWALTCCSVSQMGSGVSEGPASWGEKE